MIVNADDFGLTPGVNQAVVELHQTGALTSATLMANAPCFEQAVALSTQHPALGIGCHIVLVDGTPVSRPDEISTLLDPQSPAPAFRASLGHFVRDLLLGRIQARHIQLEAEAQIRRLQAHGLAVTHCDTHKHTHMFPRVLEPVLQAVRACNVRAIRNPFEPAWSILKTPGASVVRRLEVQFLHTLHSHFSSKVRALGLATTDGSLGVLATGTLDGTTIQSILKFLPEGTWELVCHPAYVDAELRATRTRLIDSREVELDALRTTLSGDLGDFSSLPRIHFGDLVTNLAPIIKNPATNAPAPASYPGAEK